MKEIEKLRIRPFTKFCMSIGAVPTSYLAGLTIEEQLLWLCSYLEKEVIPTVNNNGEAVEELQELYIELKSYVDNYFDNLDVQEEINNKLDDMAESGQLTEIIAQYLQLAGLLCFNNVADMKSAENLVNGSFVRTFGYYNINDGGSALYKIRNVTNQDEEDDMFIIALNNEQLIAELVIENGKINMKQIGAKSGDNTFDCTPLLKKAIIKAKSTKDYSIIYFPSGKYYCLTGIDFNTENIDVEGLNIEGSGRNYTGNIPGTVIYYKGSANTYFITFAALNNMNFRNLKIVGNSNNNCFDMEKACFYTNFENIEFTGFLNHIWLKVYTGYVKFIDCSFDNAIDNCIGVILNQHYTDGRETTSSINTEYVYFIRCNMDAGNHNAKHIMIHETEFLYIDSCDLCNTSDTAIYMDSSDWGGLLNDISITNCSFCRNKNHIYIKNGTGETRSIMITDNHYTRKNTNDTTEKILTIRGNSDSLVYYSKISGTCDSYANATNAIDCEYAQYLDLDFDGQVHFPRQSNSIIRGINKSIYGKQPRLEYITPTVTINGNSIEYDFSSSLATDECCQISANGIIHSGGIYLSALLLYGSVYKQQVIAGGGANVTSVTFNNKKLTVNCGFAPTASLDNIRFLKIK